GAAEHADIGAGAEDFFVGGCQHHGFYFRVLETQALDNVVEFNVHAQVIGVHLQLIAVEQAGVFIHRHGHMGDGAVGGQSPVPVLVGGGPEVDHFAASSVVVGARFQRVRCIREDHYQTQTRIIM